MSTPTPLVQFAEQALRRRLALFKPDELDHERVEPFVEEKVALFATMAEADLSEQLLMELGPHEFHIC